MERRHLPSVDQFVADLGEWPLPRATLVAVARSVIDEARQSGAGDLTSLARIRLEDLLLDRQRPVINATGVLLHTNLGRAPLATGAAEAATQAAVGYSSLELDLKTGERGRRNPYLAGLLASLTTAEAALVVNNNAAALMLVVAALAHDREVIISRGELIEIGGSYRLPEVIAAGGAVLREVGTTNRTRIADYSAAVGDTTGCLLKVHPSNYRITGFTEQVTVGVLRSVSEEHNLPLVFDVGSGLLDETTPWLSGPPPTWLGGEPGIRQSLRSGADLVLFSGDKLFGGPQAGIIVGRSALIDRARRHPLARAVRIDGSTAAALTATAEMYADGRGHEVPIWRMASMPYRALEQRLERLQAQIDLPTRIEESSSVLGAGSVPGEGIPSPVLVIEREASRIFNSLLRGRPAVLGRREAGRVMLDLRAVPELDDPALTQALQAACQ
ncbi:MAG TPA: L-seryl-tRNA(Sec) selenium transferase [Acidimicrobiia bacterium]|jgi:L-seryl-tRNA(Ser) seleniumtransferase|nr:L-seryl-tRNA(Sec) selenium transferase [Acidimicrobiia bacterium]